ncbi:hypothetical protein GCM10007385_15920 [Tateyamaria omphalii]|uniref:hypothetical protein n=1 Tax=Tateyamaria omphalii TaxID=299262 RepID=UPI001677E935|nr:hypothetical protein [Tateyamaria omphalii]GGX48697.1 hypothetical protein GCM10007385_15920 [Tateyamaria omphalii]
MIALYLVAGFVCSFAAASASIFFEWGILATFASYCLGGMIGMTLIALWSFLSSQAVSKAVAGVLAVGGKQGES